MKLDKSSDTSGLTQVALLSDELEPIFEKAENKYSDCDIELFFVFRCLPEEYERKSMVRYVKKDNTIYFDMTVSENKFKTLTKQEQRYELSHYFYIFLCQNLKKYKIAALHTDEFLADMGRWLKEIGWIKTEAEVDQDEV
jgi:hypothetical protein